MFICCLTRTLDAERLHLPDTNGSHLGTVGGLRLPGYCEEVSLVSSFAFIRNWINCLCHQPTTPCCLWQTNLCQSNMYVYVNACHCPFSRFPWGGARTTISTCVLWWLFMLWLDASLRAGRLAMLLLDVSLRADMLCCCLGRQPASWHETQHPGLYCPLSIKPQTTFDLVWSVNILTLCLGKCSRISATSTCIL